jgi:hypothetical protein
VEEVRGTEYKDFYILDILDSLLVASSVFEIAQIIREALSLQHKMANENDHATAEVNGSNGTNGSNGVNGSNATNGASGYQYSRQYLGKPRPIRIVVAGAGVSGIAAVKLFKEKFVGQPVDLQIYEKNPDVGGTWFENRYPGYESFIQCWKVLRNRLLT